MGISGKCFEILESKHPNHASSSLDFPNGSGYDQDVPIGHGGYAPLVEGDTDNEDEDLDGDIVDDEDSGEMVEPVDEEDDMGDEQTWDDDSDDREFEAEMAGSKRLRLRLREILFYDDKVAVFKARHGRL